MEKPMSLKDSFNDQNYNFSKRTDTVLGVGNGVNGFYFDFALRVMSVGNGGAVPFSQLDRDMLVELRDKLMALGGHPPELPAEAPSNPGSNRKFTA